MPRGRFITLEGGEGSGKSTQARLLAERLEGRGIGVVLTREPGGSPFAEEVRSFILDSAAAPHSALSEALMFYAARADHLARTIRPALDAGRWVVCDRFSDSTRVYQGYAGTLDFGLIDQLEAMIVAPTTPELTLIIDLSVAEGLARARARQKGSAAPGADPYERRDIAYHERLRAGFLEIARREPDRCVVIDGSPRAEDVSRAVWAAVERRLLAGTR
jgi:dTMP kinase